MPNAASIAGLLLAGGHSRRFGSDKARATLDGVTLIERGIARLRPQVGFLAVSAAGLPSGIADLGLPVLPDPVEDQGPLAGILAGLAWAKQQEPKPRGLVTVAVDTPFFPHDLVEKLAKAGRDGRIAIAGSQTGTHPAFAFWPRGVEVKLAAYFDRGGRKLHDLMALNDAAVVEFPPETIGGEPVDPFFNINTQADLAFAERLLKRA